MEQSKPDGATTSDGAKPGEGELLFGRPRKTVLYGAFGVLVLVVVVAVALTTLGSSGSSANGPVVSPAARTASLLLRATHPDGTPVTGANAVLLSESGTELASRQTDAEGGVAFGALPSGNFTVRMTNGNQSLESAIELYEGQEYRSAFVFYAQ